MNHIDFVETIGQQKMKQLREIVNPTGKKSNWLNLLNDYQLAEVYSRLHNGERPYTITRMIQTEWNIKPKSDAKSLCRAVRAFVKDAIGEIRRDAYARGESPAKALQSEKKVGAVAEKMNAINEYVWMLTQQRNRIQALITHETSTDPQGRQRLPMEMTDKAMRNFREMLDGYIEQCIKLGIIDHTPPELHITMKHQFEKLMNVTVQNDRDKLIMACDRFVEQLEDAAILLEQDANGNYVIPEKKE